ncbi:caldesmon isoform X1 [Eurosta solidaginis]|uniref:caldesmon isoform X1 n=1 Tax=Eurosta solidaginis TaxID=178769 RepID=UPI0035306F43
MRAHFAGDVATAEAPTDAGDDRIDKIESEAEPEAEPLDARIEEFKQDTNNMEVVSEFIDDVLHKAEEEAVKQQGTKNGIKSQQPKEKTRQSFKNGKMVNRARGLVVRIFDAICNCANTAAGPAQRIKLRAKRAASVATASRAENGTEAKKQDVNGKEKKADKKQKDASAKTTKGKDVAINEENGAANADTPTDEEVEKKEVVDEADKKEKQEGDGDKQQ